MLQLRETVEALDLCDARVFDVEASQVRVDLVEPDDVLLDVVDVVPILAAEMEAHRAWHANAPWKPAKMDNHVVPVGHLVPSPAKSRGGLLVYGICSGFRAFKVFVLDKSGKKWNERGPAATRSRPYTTGGPSRFQEDIDFLPAHDKS
ncbi:MAG: hypothetical protein Q6373_015700 [Candidatus Sigynarchaeota archaeon]